MSAQIYDARVCKLGEGPLWHPLRKQLFWFDILGNRMLSVQDGSPLEWTFDENVSAAGWIDFDTLIIASETGLWRFELEAGTLDLIVALEADTPATRSNDGRADPWGGFWIGTMGKRADAGAGSIYRYYRGELRRLFERINVSNSICFAPDRSVAYYTDTHSRQIMRQPLKSDDGWPLGAPDVFVDLTKTDLNPDGSVVDAKGCLWNAQWGASRVARYNPEGALVSVHKLPAVQASCPAFGGDGFQTLFVTSAAVGLSGEMNGRTFCLKVDAIGQAEPAVIA